MASSDIRAAMAARTAEELRAICSEDAPDYTAEALEHARAELVARGIDATELVARVGEPRVAPQSLVHRAGKLYIAALLGSMILAAIFGASRSPLAASLFTITRAAGFLAFVGLLYERVTRSRPASTPKGTNDSKS